MFDAPLAEGVVGRGIGRGLVDVAVHDLRDFTTDRHRVVDDVPYRRRAGHGAEAGAAVPRGRAHPRRRGDARRGGADLAAGPRADAGGSGAAGRGSGTSSMLCGRYEGVDERVREHVATEEISIGDYVLSGGELAALVIIDAVSRLVPGVVGDERSVGEDSFTRGLLDYPHYTRPAEFRGWTVPDVLLSGHHARDRTVAAARGAAPHAGAAAGSAGRRDARRRGAGAVRELQDEEGADHERD